MTPRQLEVLEIIRQHQPVQRGAVAKMLGISPLTAGVHLSAVRESGLAHPSGRGRHTTWSLKGPKAATPGDPFANANSIFGFAAQQA